MFEKIRIAGVFSGLIGLGNTLFSCLLRLRSGAVDGFGGAGN